MSGTYMLCIKTSSDIDLKLYYKYLKLPRRFADQGFISGTNVKVTGDPTRRFREIYHYSANFYPISLKFSPNIVR